MKRTNHDPIPRESEILLAHDKKAGSSLLEFFAFNTVVSITVFDDFKRADNALAASLEACRRFERLFSRTLPNSDVSRINSSGGFLVEIDRDTFNLIASSLSFCADSLDLFDVTMGSVSRLWDFKNGTIPSEEAINNELQHVGFSNIELYEAGGRFFAQLNDPLARIDLGGIAKGFIADKLAALFKETGIESCLINLGGNVYALGRKPDGSRWRIGIKDPNDVSNVIGSIELENCAAVTSGTYDRSFVKNGKRYHHILNPSTGKPVDSDVASVTITSPSALTAEGYSTTLLCLGKHDGVKFAQSKTGIMQAFFIDNTGEIAYARKQTPHI